MTTQTHSILFAVLLICAAADAGAQTIYSQVDDQGRTVFSDRPPSRRIVAERRGGKVDVREAARRLGQARLERSRGVAPGLGEFTQGASARTVNHRYWLRQERLRLAVEKALRRSQETLRVQLASG